MISLLENIFTNGQNSKNNIKARFQDQITALNNIGNSYNSKGQYVSVMKFYQIAFKKLKFLLKSEKIRKLILENNHPAIVESLLSIEVAYTQKIIQNSRIRIYFNFIISKLEEQILSFLKFTQSQQQIKNKKRNHPKIVSVTQAIQRKNKSKSKSKSA